MTCPLCLDFQLVTTDTPQGARAEPCPRCVGVCGSCQGSGYVLRRSPDGYTDLVPCSCRKVGRRADLYNAAGLPGRFHRAKLFNFEERVEDHAAILEYLDGWAREFRPGIEGILFFGPTGIGKTHLMAALVRHVTLVLSSPARFVDFFQLLARIREAYSTGRSEMALLGPLLDTPLLAIDELGKGKAGDWERGVLDQLISHRYNNQLTTLFTTNHPLEPDPAEKSLGGRLVLRSPEDLEKVLGTPPLEERVGVRIYSRIREMCRPIALRGADDIRTSVLARPPLRGEG
ncbi:MAG: ATP-binding protein [Myxococcota bacterium]|jgi:DNA replication protein DnaC|nr:ATP-binding protein [Myxococcota bacterium]